MPAKESVKFEFIGLPILLPERKRDLIHRLKMGFGGRRPTQGSLRGYAPSINIVPKAPKSIAASDAFCVPRAALMVS